MKSPSASSVSPSHVPPLGTRPGQTVIIRSSTLRRTQRHRAARRRRRSFTHLHRNACGPAPVIDRSTSLAEFYNDIETAAAERGRCSSCRPTFLPLFSHPLVHPHSDPTGRTKALGRRRPRCRPVLPLAVSASDTHTRRPIPHENSISRFMHDFPAPLYSCSFDVR